MSILSDADILKFLMEGRLVIGDFQERNLTPNGYDVTIGEIYLPKENRKVREGSLEIPPLSSFLISTKEFLELGGDLTAQLWIRTSWARKGILSSFGKIDAGFRGTLTLAAFNSSHEAISLSIGETFAQVVFEKVQTPPLKLYEERSGNYQNQRGITLKKP